MDRNSLYTRILREFDFTASKISIRFECLTLYLNEEFTSMYYFLYILYLHFAYVSHKTSFDNAIL